jgi:hypothetical protein
MIIWTRSESTENVKDLIFSIISKIERFGKSMRSKISRSRFNRDNISAAPALTGTIF